ncbi:ribosomal protein S18-alanine N-acetyltransferase [Carnobacterium gallinarum]|uniref:ribosomal protein S18-alanine N-acetyltransferase n=1 Tax=Carnobacterium gallinarum TaxID=2749 RepID=UPI0005558F17|nr:ribosomal protein S18-alanine N-acetyltransferase [Carnobacterium gallinarum]
MIEKLDKNQIRFIEIKETRYTGVDLFEVAEKSYDHESPWSAETFNKDLKQPYVQYFMALEEHKIIGFVGYRQIFEEVEITNIVVAAELKDQGIGTELLNQWLDYLRTSEAGVVHLEVRKSNKLAIHVYKKLGFQLVNIRQDYYDYPVEDAIIMKLAL